VIRPERLDQVARILARTGLDDDILGALREAFRDVHLTYCINEDIGTGEPIRRADGFNMYLVDGRGHCPCLTTDMEAATGIVLAKVEKAKDE
jgi:hypothetical protein